MASLFTLYKNVIGALVAYAEVDLGAGSDGTPRRLPRSAPSDETGASLFNSANPGHVTLDAQAAGLASEAKLELIRALLAGTVGISAQSLPLPAGAATDAKVEAVRALLAGTLGISAASLPLPAGAATDAKVEAVRALLAGTLTVSVANEIEIKNDAGNPVLMKGVPGVTPTQSYVAVPLYSATDATTVKTVATTTTATGFLTIDNTGSADVELWFGTSPASAAVSQTPRQGKVLPAGAGLFFDVKIPVGPIYATGLGATGLSVITGV